MRCRGEVRGLPGRPGSAGGIRGAGGGDQGGCYDGGRRGGHGGCPGSTGEAAWHVAEVSRWDLNSARWIVPL